MMFVRIQQFNGENNMNMYFEGASLNYSCQLLHYKYDLFYNLLPSTLKGLNIDIVYDDV